VNNDDDQDFDDAQDSGEIVTEEMLWERIPQTSGLERANTFYELSARIYARGQYDEALALAESARDIYAELGPIGTSDGLAQAYSAIGYNLNQLKRNSEAATAMSKAVEILRESKSPLAIDLACTLGEWWFGSKNYEKTIECMRECVQEHLVEGNEGGAANDLHLIGCAYRELNQHEQSLTAFKEARLLFKSLKEVINVARCDQKIAHALIEIGDGESALIAAQKSLDVFVTAHDHRRETYSLLELGKAQILTGQEQEGLDTLERVLEIATESEWKDFEFIVDIERRIAGVLRSLGRLDEADEIERRLTSVTEVTED
jgi:tetratricopeptide (TPR) repeat protein